MGFFIHFNSFCNPTRDGSKNKNISYHQPATSANLYKTVPCSENASMWALGFKSSNCSPPEMNLLLLICDHPTCASSCRQMSTSPDAGKGLLCHFDMLFDIRLNRRQLELGCGLSLSERFLRCHLMWGEAERIWGSVWFRAQKQSCCLYF